MATPKKVFPRSYWRQREEKQHAVNKARARQYEKDIRKIYRKTLDAVQKEINSFYMEYADENGLTLSQARKRLKRADATKWKQANENFKRNPHSMLAKQYFELLDARAKLNRLELLKAQIGLALLEQGEDLEKYFGDNLTEEALRELERQAGVFGEFIGANPAERMKSIVTASFHNATWSERIWSYQDELQGQLETMLIKAMIVGRNPKHPEFINQLTKHFNTSRYNAERLMHTEMARIQTEVQMDSFKRNGYEYYEYICCGGGAGNNPNDPCPRCKALDGKVFKVSEKEIGINAPPSHPSCHCSTSAYYGTPPEEANSAQLTEVTNKLIEQCNNSGIEYNKLKPLEKTLMEKEIIEKISGGDLTKGSCVSLAYTYTGNKAGFDVLDFRGGKSLNFFSRKFLTNIIKDFPGVTSFTEKSTNEIKAANKLVQNAEIGKEYILFAGKHAAVIKKIKDNDFEYLELQSQNNSGFHSLTLDVLKSRFGCRKSRTTMGQKAEVSSYLIECESLGKSKDFQELLGYLNTKTNEQQKGAGGSAK